MSRLPPNSKFHSTDGKDKQLSSDHQTSTIKSTLSRRSTVRPNPTASTSSSTLVNELPDGPPEDQKFPQPLDLFDYRATCHLNVFELPVGAQLTRNASNSQLVHSSEQLSQLLHQDSRFQYSNSSKTNPSFPNDSAPHHPSKSTSESAPASIQPPPPPLQDHSHSTTTSTPNPEKITSKTASEPTQPPLPRRKPRSSLRDQQLLQKLTNSPNKLHLNRTIPKNLTPQFDPLAKIIQSTNFETQPEAGETSKSDVEAHPVARDMPRAHEASISEDEEHDTDSSALLPEARSKLLNQLVKRIMNAPISSLPPTSSSIPEKAQSTHSRVEAIPPRPLDTKLPSRVPSDRLHDTFQVANNNSQQTRQATSAQVKETRRSTSNTFTDNSNQTSESTTNAPLNRPLHPQPVHAIVQDNKSRNSAKRTDDSHSYHTSRTPGWRSHPLLTPKNATSDTDSPEDVVKSNLTVPQPIDNQSDEVDVIGDTLSKSRTRNPPDTHKPLTRHIPDTQRKVTFSQVLSDDARGTVSKNMLFTLASHAQPAPPFVSSNSPAIYPHLVHHARKTQLTCQPAPPRKILKILPCWIPIL